MWISKEAEVRKKEIIDAALDLFYTLGYEKTSINDIIKKVGVTKGSFYYHFKSKEEILDIIALQQAEELVAVFRKAAEKKDENSLEKINKAISDMQKYRAETKVKRSKFFEILGQRENLKLKQKVLENYMRLGKPILIKIIEAGIKEGMFTTDYPDELAELYIHFSIIINSNLNGLIMSLEESPENIEVINRKVLFYNEMLEKILGVKNGSIKFADSVLNILNHYKENSDFL